MQEYLTKASIPFIPGSEKAMDAFFKEHTAYDIGAMSGAEKLYNIIELIQNDEDLMFEYGGDSPVEFKRDHDEVIGLYFEKGKLYFNSKIYFKEQSLDDILRVNYGEWDGLDDYRLPVNYIAL